MTFVREFALVPGSVVGDVAVGGGTAVAVVCMWALALSTELKRYRSEFRARGRSRRARAALTEASLEDEWFAPEVMRATVDEILEVASAVWRDGELTLPTRVDGRLIERWAGSISDWVGGDGVRLMHAPEVDVLRVIDRPGELEDRLVLRVRLRLRRLGADVGLRTVRADLRWTLGRRDGSWILLLMDSDPLATSELDRPSIVAHWADTERLREQSLLELADADAVAPGAAELSELVPRDAPAQRQLLELAQLDGRFDPDLLAARVGHIVEAWEEACTGSTQPLADVAAIDAQRVLLHPPAGDAGRRLVLRDAVVERWTVTELELSAVPPRIRLAVNVSAVRYLVNNLTGEPLGGRPDVRTAIELGWTLALTDSHPAVWRLTATTDPAEELSAGD